MDNFTSAFDVKRHKRRVWAVAVAKGLVDKCSHASRYEVDPEQIFGACVDCIAGFLEKLPESWGDG